MEKMKSSHRLKAIEMGKRVRRISCYRKKAFTFDAAEKVSKKWNQRVYHCPFCGMYHLTKNVGEE